MQKAKNAKIEFSECAQVGHENSRTKNELSTLYNEWIEVLW